MRCDEAIKALKPYTSKVPTEALDYIRSHWEEAEPVLLAEIERRMQEDLSIQERKHWTKLPKISVNRLMLCSIAAKSYCAL